MVTLNGVMLLTDTCRPTTIEMENIVAFPWRPWLREHATILRYSAYIAYLVVPFLCLSLQFL